ncbi:unnamed protein product [Calypogeia fissa]
MGAKRKNRSEVAGHLGAEISAKVAAYSVVVEALEKGVKDVKDEVQEKEMWRITGEKISRSLLERRSGQV